MDPKVIARFNSYPLRPEYVFHCGLIRLPFWLDDADDPYRPHLALCACPESTSINASELIGTDQSPFEALLSAIAGLGRISTIEHVRPGQVVTTDPEIGQFLRQALRDSGVAVEVADEDPLLQKFAEGLAQAHVIPNAPAGALEGEGMTVERLELFADAARRFWQAAPWRYLTDQDLICVESPQPPDELSCVSVLGNGGQTFGLGFFHTRGQFEAMAVAPDPMRFMNHQGCLWSMSFGRIDEIPVGDAEIFEERGLPIAADNAYPCLVGNNLKAKKLVRPDAAAVGYVEGLLRALAQTTEEQMDSGRWTQEVETADGTVRYILTLPDLIPTPQERREMAEELLDDAFHARGRKQLQLARQAVAVDPDFSDPYLLLADRESDPQRSVELLHKAVEIARKALPDTTLDEGAGRLWLWMEARPYMRARLALANALHDAGQLQEAADHYAELLRLNPADNQGVRDVYGPVLFGLGRYDDLRDLLDRYREEAAQSLFLRALLLFRTTGDSPEARDAGTAALRSNRFARKYLLGDASLPPAPNRYALGSEEEAIITAMNQDVYWDQTPGACEWLAKLKVPRGGASKKKAPPRRGKRK